MTFYKKLSKIIKIKYKEEYFKGKREYKKNIEKNLSNEKIKELKSENKKEINESKDEREYFNKSIKNDTFIIFKIYKNINFKSEERIKFSKDKSDIICYQNYERTENKIFSKNINNKIN